MDYKEFFNEVGRLLEIWNRGESNPDELIDDIENAQRSVQTTFLMLCPYCEHEHDKRVACPQYIAKSQKSPKPFTKPFKS